MRVLDLFSGLGGWSAAFKERGHDVLTVDIEPKFKPDIVADILTINSIDKLYNKQGAETFDIVLASPPCEKFSIAAAWMHNWKKDKNGIYKPNNAKAKQALKVVAHTFWLLENTFSGKYYVVENPRGYMRLVFTKPEAEVNYCQYASDKEIASPNYFKATDLWGKLPPSFIPKKCRSGNKDHVFTGGHNDYQFATRGIRKDETSAAKRALIPYGLSEAMCIAAESDLAWERSGVFG
jgi:hypothetical protein